MTEGPKGWHSPAFVLISQQKNGTVQHVCQKTSKSAALLQKCCTVPKSPWLGSQNYGSVQHFLLVFLQELYCPKVFVVRDQKFWHGTTLLRAFVQKCCTVLIPLAKRAEALDCPKLWGLQSPDSFTGSKNCFFWFSCTVWLFLLAGIRTTGLIDVTGFLVLK